LYLTKYKSIIESCKYVVLTYFIDQYRTDKSSCKIEFNSSRGSFNFEYSIKLPSDEENITLNSSNLYDVTFKNVGKGNVEIIIRDIINSRM
jgi:hypothetical protein